MMKTISSTGNNHRRGRRGLTFLELMTTTAILGVGIVGIYKALLASLDYQRHLTCRLHAMNLMDHEIARIQTMYQGAGELPEGENGKVYEVLLNHAAIPFQVTLDGKQFQAADQLLWLDVTLSWPERGRSFKITRSVYLVKI